MLFLGRESSALEIPGGLSPAYTRRRHDLSSVFMTVGDADTVHLGRSPSAEKHVHIGVGHETALEGIWRGTSL